MRARGNAKLRIVVGSALVAGSALMVAACTAIVGVEDITAATSTDAGTTHRGDGGADSGVDVPVIRLPHKDASPLDAPKGDARVDSPQGADGSVDGHRPDADAALPPSAAVAVASSIGASDWCVVTANGDVECWGENESGELGDGTTTGSQSPVKVHGLPGPAATVAVGVGTGCVVTRAGAAYCWGYGQDGELGNNTMDNSLTAVPVTGLDTGVTAIASGFVNGCAIQNGGVVCWGSPEDQLLGPNLSDDALTPIAVPGLETGVTSLSIGGDVACAVKDGEALCWGGFGGTGDLGNNTTNGSYAPVKVQGLPAGVVAVSAGLDFACALTGAGGVLCWGDGDAGQLGNGQFASSSTAVQVQGLENGVLAVSAGAEATSVIKTDGTIVSWGEDADGELGNGSTLADGGVGLQAAGASPVPVAALGVVGTPVAISAGEAPCIVTSFGTVECWSFICENDPTPVPVSQVGRSTSITMGGNLSPDLFACAIEGGSVYCWGSSDYGQLGNDTTVGATKPVANVTLESSTTVVSAGKLGNFACAVSSGSAYCWGDNATGQLGDGTTTERLHPVGVVGLSVGVESIGAGGGFACALATLPDGGPGGAVSCWGDNTFGELGNDSATASFLPVPVKGLESGVTAVAVGAFSACAVLSDGSAECWGNNAAGQLGDGTTTDRLAPVRVTGLSDVTSISVGINTACAVTASGIACWGDNSVGELGNDGNPQSYVPVMVQGIGSGVTAVSAGAGETCAVVSGGAQCWGDQPLGNGTDPGEYFPTPEAVDGLASGVTGIAVGNGTVCATTTSKVLCWGLNSSGQLGNGGAVDSLVPTPVAGFP